MKVRQEPPARMGYHGKQGGERFRTILKYPFASDMAMKRFRDNDTSLRSWRRTRQRLDSYGADSQSAVRWFPEGNRPLSQGCVANMGNIDFGMTARFISGSRLLHTQRKEVMAHDERKLGISPWRYLLR